MPGLVLNLGEQDGLSFERGRTRDPVAFRQHANDLRMGVLGHLPDQGLAVGRRHPVLGLDLNVRINAILEGLLFRCHFFPRLYGVDARFHHLRIHCLAPICTLSSFQCLGRLSITRFALPTAVRAILSGSRILTLVLTPTKVLILSLSSFPSATISARTRRGD